MNTNPPLYTRRHSRIHEKILLNYFFQLSIGLGLLISITAIPIWGLNFWESEDPNCFPALSAVSIGFTICTFTIRKLLRLPGSKSVSFIFPTGTIIFGLMMVLFLIKRLNYSNQVLSIGYVFSLLWSYIGYFIGNRYRNNRYAIVPFGEGKEIEIAHGALIVFLKKPDLEEQRFNAVIADLHSNELTPEWEKFLAHCTLNRIPVYHTKHIKEALTGRVKIDHLSENEFGSLLPSPFYELLKRGIDLIVSILLLPILLILFTAIGIIIKFESRGPIFFLQKRMGFRGRSFTMFKFRSMYIDKKGKGFTQGEDDPRITKFGKIARKYRIDELPQIFNIILGQMSFIGPRPESFELSLWYEKDVPFFAYRHIVRPGISGWAQVNQGYAAEVDGMNVKLEYDFYYIKHFSFWLDLLITFKTIKTIVSGFGAR